MLLFAGLGNPGEKYAGNRHNVGFMALDAIASEHGFPGWKSRDDALVSEGRIGDSRLVLVKPQSFMNNSGMPLGSIARFFKIDPERIFVFHDEVELAPGKIRIKKGGGHAGHNGLRDIDSHVGQGYWRVRIGVGRPENARHAQPALAQGTIAFLSANDLIRRPSPGGGSMLGWVLGDFGKSERADWLDRLLDSMAGEAALLAAGDTNAFMSRVAHLAPAPATTTDAGS